MKSLLKALCAVTLVAANAALLPLYRQLERELDLVVMALGHLEVSVLVIGTYRYLIRKSCPQS